MSHPFARAAVAGAGFFLLLGLLMVCRQFALRGQKDSDQTRAGS